MFMFSEGYHNKLSAMKNAFWKQIILNKILDRHKKKSYSHTKLHSRFILARAYREFKINSIWLIKDSILMLLGIASAAFGLKSFLLPAKFIDGGATGISLLVTAITNIPLYILLLIINLPFIFLG